MALTEQEKSELGIELLRMCGWKPGTKISRDEVLVTLLPFLNNLFGLEYAPNNEEEKEEPLQK